MTGEHYGLRVLTKTFFMIEDTLTLDYHGKFLNYLDQFEDYAGKYLGGTVEDLKNAPEEMRAKCEEILENTVTLLWSRLDTFAKFEGIVLKEEFIKKQKLKTEWDNL